eukprot:UN28333
MVEECLRLKSIKLDLLKTVKKLLEELKVLIWMDCGTLLGTYRSGSMIPHDWDIDIACGFPDQTKDIKSIDDLFVIVKKRLGVDKDIQIKLTNTRGITITIPKHGSRSYTSVDSALKEEKYPHVYLDIYSGDCVEKNKYIDMIYNDWPRKRHAFTDMFPVKYSKFEGIDVPIPKDAKKI